MIKRKDRILEGTVSKPNVRSAVCFLAPGILGEQCSVHWWKGLDALTHLGSTSLPPSIFLTASFINCPFSAVTVIPIEEQTLQRRIVKNINDDIDDDFKFFDRS